jgi:hypothetical protein
MTAITIQLPEDQAERLTAVARRHNLSVEQLAAAHLQELLKEPDKRFEEAVAFVLKKNAELYRRLA